MTNNQQLELSAASQPHEALPMLSPMETRDLLKAAIEKGGVEAVERIAALYERAQEKAAARAFHDALSRFSAGMKPITKTKTVNFATRSGSDVSYSYAPLEEIARVISEPLKAAGLSYTWDSDVAENRITVTCTVRHIDGHSATAKFTCPTDSANGALSSQQKVAAALTFGRRQSLVQALGLTTCDQDHDGAEIVDEGDTITEKQSLELQTLMADVKADKVRFLQWLGVDTFADIPASRYAEAVQALKQKGHKA